MKVILDVGDWTVIYITEIPEGCTDYYQRRIEPYAYTSYIPAEARIYFSPVKEYGRTVYETLPGLGIKTIDRSVHDRLLETSSIAGILRDSGL